MAADECTKKCLDCGLVKSTDEFYFEKRDGRYSSRCKPCHNKRSIEGSRRLRERLKITQEYLRRNFRYDESTGELTRTVHTGGAGVPNVAIGTRDAKGHLRANIGGRGEFVHRLIWLYVTGEWPKQQIDHVNGIGDDNRWANLREATPTQNKCNQPVRRDSASGLKGVHQDRITGRWRAYISVDRKRINLGFFATKEEAHAARLRASCMHGDFARES